MTYLIIAIAIIACLVWMLKMNYRLNELEAPNRTEMAGRNRLTERVQNLEKITNHLNPNTK